MSIYAYFVLKRIIRGGVIMFKSGKSEKFYGSYCRINSYRRYNGNDLNHVHDYSGRTRLAGEKLHDHGFSYVTGKGIPVGSGRHVHRYMNKTTFDLEHNHRMMGTTGIDISVPGGGHVHNEKSVTSFSHGHRHGVKFTSSVERKAKRNKYYGNNSCCRDYSY